MTVHPGDAITIPGGMRYEYEAAIVIRDIPAENFPDGTSSLHMVETSVFAPGTEWHGERVRIAAGWLANRNALDEAEAAAAWLAAVERWRDREIRAAATQGNSQRAIAQRVRMSQPGVKGILDRGCD